MNIYQAVGEVLVLPVPKIGVNYLIFYAFP